MELKTDYYDPDGKEPFKMKLESGNETWGLAKVTQKGYSGNKGEYGFRVFFVEGD